MPKEISRAEYMRSALHLTAKCVELERDLAIARNALVQIADLRDKKGATLFEGGCRDIAQAALDAIDKAGAL